MNSILPPNATELERDLEKIIRHDLPFPNRDLWNADKCPERLLVYLAWALSVDQWSESWPEAEKRAIIKNALFIHNVRGTRAAVERIILAATAYNAKIVEWFEDPARLKIGEFSIRLFVDGQIIDAASLKPLVPLINRAKNVRSYFKFFEIVLASRTAENYAMATRINLTVRSDAKI